MSTDDTIAMYVGYAFFCLGLGVLVFGLAYTVVELIGAIIKRLDT